jgi:hypothetical protein
VTFIVEGIDIYHGEVDKMYYMTKNQNHRIRWEKGAMSEVVFGMAIKGNLLNESGLLSLKYGSSKYGQIGEYGKLRNCTQDVYQRMNEHTRKVAPVGMDVYCFVVSAQEIDRNYHPFFELNICKGKDKDGKVCKSQEEMDRILKRFDVWVFSLVDETDYT